MLRYKTETRPGL